MKCSKEPFAVVTGLFAVLVSLGIGTASARDADLVPLNFVAAQTAKQQCQSYCGARYRDCRHLNKLPSFECRDVYQDCTRYNCRGP
jgi:hypothetical protein